jgi:hypothetical protein
MSKKSRQNNYPIVDELPDGAIRVSEFAEEWPCNTSYIYKLVSEGKNESHNFYIVVFKGINFVIKMN